jgi:hypothetical protein
MIRWLLVIAAALTIGCGGGDGALQVTGKVTNADGSPIQCEGGMVLFQPATIGENASGKHATGGMKSDGTFEMMTRTPGDGMQPGQYKVVLQLWKNYNKQELAVPQKYGDATTTPLEATVDGDHTHFEFKVEPGA